jgi:hypothetical protein
MEMCRDLHACVAASPTMVSAAALSQFKRMTDKHWSSSHKSKTMGLECRCVSAASISSDSAVEAEMTVCFRDFQETGHPATYATAPP